MNIFKTYWLQLVVTVSILLSFFNFKIWEPLEPLVWNNNTSINIFSVIISILLIGMSWTMISKNRKERTMPLFSLCTFLQFYFVIDATLGPWFKWGMVHLIGLDTSEPAVRPYQPNITNLIGMTMVGISGLIYIFNTQKMRTRLKWLGGSIIGMIIAALTIDIFSIETGALGTYKEISLFNYGIYLLYGLFLVKYNNSLVSPHNKYNHEVQPRLV